jgi:hypothetical protein
MQELKAGDPLAPVTATHVAAVPYVKGVVFRMDYITRNDQPLDAADTSLNFILKSAQVRELAKNLLDAADRIDQADVQATA